MKPILITFHKEFQDASHKQLQKMSYEKVYVLTLKNSITIKSKGKKIIPVIIESKKEIQKKIDEIFLENKDKMILPYFEGDANSKYSIKIYNKTFNTKVDYKKFKIKSEMNKLIEKHTNKKNQRFKYNELIKTNYSIIKETFGEHFILKPINAASSLLNFKIINEEKYNSAIAKLRSKYEYIIEEYIHGNLYATDFYFDTKDIYITCHTREVTFSEIVNKLSKEYIERYEKVLNENFMHFLPVRYTIPVEKIPKKFISFIKKIAIPLQEMNYRGFIHLEYKYDAESQQIGFIEWGARTGGNRRTYVKSIHNARCENMPANILALNNKNNFLKKDGVYILDNRDHDKNYVGLKTNVVEKMHLMNLIKKHPNFMKYSYSDFLKQLFNEKWKISINDINFNIQTTSDYYIYPFYERSDTKFDYTLQLDEENFAKFLKRKYSIIEKLIFHNY